jgi:ribonuclease HII
MKKSSSISFKNLKNDKLIICGIDEAGRGPAFGPMIICGVCFYKDQVEILKNIGVKDSKKLSSKKRKELAVIIKQKAISFKVVEISAEEIDQRKEKKITLNRLEEIYMAEIVNDLTPDEIYIDAVDVNEVRFKKSIEDLLKYKPKKIITKHKADCIYPVVSASSIIAKDLRDSVIEELKTEYGNIGSGYPSDAKTIEFLRNWLLKYKEVPPFARKTWLTTKELFNKELKNKKITDYII